MADLATLFTAHMSDKNTNGYTSLYTALFTHFKHAPISLLEVGIGTMIPGAHSSMKGYMPDCYQPGASLRAWRDFFQNGEIHSMDIAPDCMLSEPRITTHLCDSTCPASVLAWTQANPDLSFDVILDDGSHWGSTSWPPSSVSSRF